jgi:hypothetical protein
MASLLHDGGEILPAADTKEQKFFASFFKKEDFCILPLRGRSFSEEKRRPPGDRSAERATT